MEHLLEKLVLNWQDINFYKEALTHTSYANEYKNLHVTHNQRLEFLGDAVLELVVSDYLYNKYKSFPEGLLTKTRAAVVCEPTLAKIATSINLGDFILIGKGEARSGGRKRPSILADALESLIGAVYLDLGMEAASTFILKLLSSCLDDNAQKGGNVGDFKTELQELVQHNSELSLSYTIVREEGPDHEKLFTAAVTFNKKSWGTGTGKTKKEAEQDAAHIALEEIKSGRVIIEKGNCNEQ